VRSFSIFPQVAGRAIFQLEVGVVRPKAQKSALLGFLALAMMLFGFSNAFSQENDSVVVVRMTNDMKFVPDQLTIKVGQTVEWVSEPEAPAHSVSTDPDKASDPSHVSFPSGAKPFDSGVIKGGKPFRHTFTVPGIYHYVCLPHEDAMRGAITVTQ